MTTEIRHEMIQKDEFLTFAQTAQRFPAFSEGSLRWLRFNGKDNGFNKCVRKIGNRCLISVRAFEEWVNSKLSETNK